MEPEELRALLTRLEIPAESCSVFGSLRRADGALQVHLSSTTFWRLVKRLGGEVQSGERDDVLFPYRHRLLVEGVEFFTFSSDPVLPPGTVTPGYALRLT